MWSTSVIVIVWLIVSAYLIKVFFKQIFAWACSRLSKKYNKKAASQKQALFAPLNRTAEETGPFRTKVLEIGGGSGANFEFVTHPVDWTLTEPNISFGRYFEAMRKVTKHRVHDLVEASGENLGKFKDESFDAVIVTLVFCTVKDLMQTINETYRVLKPGGKLYFIEHIRQTDGSFTGWCQDLLTNSGVWPFIGDGCCLNRSPHEVVQKAGFTEIDVRFFDFPTWMFLIKYQVYGWATK